MRQMPRIQRRAGYSLPTRARSGGGNDGGGNSALWNRIQQKTFKSERKRSVTAMDTNTNKTEEERKFLEAVQASNMESGSSAPSCSLDERELWVVQGLVQALAAYMYATPRLIVTELTPAIFTEREAEQLLSANSSC